MIIIMYHRILWKCKFLYTYTFSINTLMGNAMTADKSTRTPFQGALFKWQSTYSNIKNIHKQLSFLQSKSLQVHPHSDLRMILQWLLHEIEAFDRELLQLMINKHECNFLQLMINKCECNLYNLTCEHEYNPCNMGSNLTRITFLISKILLSRKEWGQKNRLYLFTMPMCQDKVFI